LDEILRDIAEVAPEYTRIEFYGGDAFLRDDLFTILDRVPPGKRITLWSICGEALKKTSLWERLRSHPIEAIKLHLSLPSVGQPTGSSGVIGFEEVLQGMRSISSLGLPVHLYVPMDRVRQFQELFISVIHQLGIERLYAFSKDLDRPLGNSVGCFGRKVGFARILWVRRMGNASQALPLMSEE